MEVMAAGCRCASCLGRIRTSGTDEPKDEFRSKKTAPWADFEGRLRWPFISPDPMIHHRLVHPGVTASSSITTNVLPAQKHVHLMEERKENQAVIAAVLSGYLFIASTYFYDITI